MFGIQKLEYNYVLFVAIISWVAAQIIKTLINAIKYKKVNPERLFGAGGMPSSHSSFVCSALVAIARQDGIGSTNFALIFIISVVVMYDAMGVRRAAGQHAQELNRIRKIIFDKSTITPDEKIKEFKEYLGHTPFEVLGGAMLGIIISLVVPMTISV